MLPRGKNLDHTISERKENARKNRYNDIKAADATRIRLRKLTGDPSSDYINVKKNLHILWRKGNNLGELNQGL